MGQHLASSLALLVVSEAQRKAIVMSVGKEPVSEGEIEKPKNTINPLPMGLAKEETRHSNC